MSLQLNGSKVPFHACHLHVLVSKPHLIDNNGQSLLYASAKVRHDYFGFHLHGRGVRALSQGPIEAQRAAVDDLRRQFQKANLSSSILPMK